MARNKPTIIETHINKTTAIATEVIKADYIYAVYYKEHPIALRQVHTLLDQQQKYPRVSFSRSGGAYLLCRKLNKLFKTDQFSVVRLSMGTVINGR